MSAFSFESIRAGDRIRVERDAVAHEGIVDYLGALNGTPCIKLLNVEGVFRTEGDKAWTFEIIGRPIPAETYSVIAWSNYLGVNSQGYVRRDDGYWCRVPSRMDSANTDVVGDRRYTFDQLIQMHGWDFNLVAAGVSA